VTWLRAISLRPAVRAAPSPPLPAFRAVKNVPPRR
jgi:hypothetical protein